MDESYSSAGDWYAMGNYGHDGYQNGISTGGCKRDIMGPLQPRGRKWSKTVPYDR